MSQKNALFAIKDPSRKEDLEKQIDDRVALVAELNNINLILSGIKVRHDPRRLQLIKRKNEITFEMQKLNAKSKVSGASINDVFRNVICETLPKDIFRLVMDEVEHRMKGNKPTVVSLLSERDIALMENAKKANDDITTLKYRILQLKTAIQEVMPDLGKSGSSEYQNNVKLFKILSKLNSIINQPL